MYSPKIYFMCIHRFIIFTFLLTEEIKLSRMSAAKKQKLKNGARATKKKRNDEDDDDFEEFDDQPRQVRKSF